MQNKHLMSVLLAELPEAQGHTRIPVLQHSSHKGFEIFGGAAASPEVR